MKAVYCHPAHLTSIQREVRWKSLSHQTLCNPMDYPVHGILQARILAWVAVPFSRWSSQPWYQSQVSHNASRFFNSWATGKPYMQSSVQLSLSCVRFSVTPWTAIHQASLSIIKSWSLPNSCPLSRGYHPTISSSEYIMKNAGLDEAQAGIKISRRNANNHRYVDDTILMAESEED